MRPTELEFLANLLYQKAAKKQGSIAIRWMCLREDIKKKYIKDAKKMFTDWINDELSAKISREQYDHLMYKK